MKGVLFLIGEFGVGKNYLSDKLVEFDPCKYKVIQQVRTRKPRVIDGKKEDGVFLTKEQYNEYKKDNKIFAHMYLPRTGNSYGCLVEELEEDKINVIEGDPDRVNDFIMDKRMDNYPVWIIYITASSKTRIMRYKKRESVFTKKAEDEMNDRIVKRDFDDRMKICEIDNFQIFYNDGVSPRYFSDFMTLILEKYPNGML